MSLEQIYNVIDDFIDWSAEVTEFWHYDRDPEEDVVTEKLEACRNKQYNDIINKYYIISLWYMYYDHFVVDNYEYRKNKLIRELLVDKSIVYKLFRCDPNDLIYDMNMIYREITKQKIFKHVYNLYCKEQIDKRNKKYAMNILWYKNILPYDIIKFEIYKMI